MVILQVIRDQAWQFGGAVVGLIGVIVAIVAIIRGQKRKRLAYEVLTNTTVIDVGKVVEGRVKILFEDRVVPRVSLLELRLANRGNTPILPTDYIEPVTIRFPEHVGILSAEVAHTKPDNLKVELLLDGLLELQPILLNDGDSVTIRFLLAGAGGQFTVTGRIAGVNRIEEEAREWYVLRWIPVFVILVWVVSLAGTWLLPKEASPTAGYWFFLLVSTALMLAMWSVFRPSFRIPRKWAERFPILTR